MTTETKPGFLQVVIRGTAIESEGIFECMPLVFLMHIKLRLFILFY